MIDPDGLSHEISEADIVVFCGGAAQSSWDAGFGDFTAEEDWLATCIDAIQPSDQRLIFISADAVFKGPWVFHDDDSKSLATDRIAKRILKHESQVASIDNSLIVRTNVLGLAPDSLVEEIADAVHSQSPIQIDASTFGTPIAAADFAKAMANCLDADTCGYINIAGAERLNPFRFATALAICLDGQADVIEPSTCSSTPIERSMRCDRQRSEHQQRPPLLRGMVECLADLSRHVVDERVAA